MLTSDTTFVIELTPRGRAAVAVVLVSGRHAGAMVEASFVAVSGRCLQQTAFDRILLGRWADSGEELIVCRRTANEIEVHCHGGEASVRTIVNDLVRRGGMHVSWRDWVRHSSSDPVSATAQIALADAPTLRTAAILLDQFHGALTTAISAALGAVLRADISAAAETIDQLLRFAPIGAHLTSAWRVVLAGPPNVGKSSLLNAVAGYQRAIVSPQPGTTRDVVTFTTALDGWPVQFADTAGLRDSGDELEAAGVALAAAAVTDAELVLLVRDANQPVDTEEFQSIERLVAENQELPRGVLHIINKIDLLSSAERHEHGAAIATSALTGEGIRELISAIITALVPINPPAGAAVPFTANQCALLLAARAAIDSSNAIAAIDSLQALLAGNE